MALVPVGFAVATACVLLGLARSTFYRVTRGYRHYQPVSDPVPQIQRRQPAALDPDERAAVVEVLSSDEYADLSVVQTYWRAFDAGLIACSQRSCYRIAAAEGLVGDRRHRNTAANPTRRHKPVVPATAVGDLWSWDVTELRGPGAQRYQLYLCIEVYSRYPVAWRVETTQDRKLAIDMFATAIAAHGAPRVLHADNGPTMRSHELVEALHEQSVLTSYSRPRVSDDNPFSESLFKTLKYDVNCPQQFDSLDHARDWTDAFLHR